MEEKVNFAFMLFRGLMKVLLLPKLDSQFPKFCGQFQGRTFMPLSHEMRACSQPAPAPKSLTSVLTTDVMVAYCNGSH